MAGLISKRVKIEDEEVKDRISDLPDEIRGHILSFLPTKDAVMMSFSSKKWVSTWTTVPNLEFDDSKTPNFKMFADRVLRIHNGSINKFIIHCNRWHGVPTCISTAVMRNVSELDITIYSFEHHLPYCIYTCESLEVLQIAGWFTLKAPNNKMVALKHLQRLSLSWVRIKGESYMTMLLSGCPVLEELFIYKLMLQNLSTFSVSSISLKRLTLNMFGGGLGLKNCSISLYVPNLEYLAIIDDVLPLNEKVFQNQASSIVSARLYIGFTEGSSSFSPGNSSPITVVKLLNYISSTITRLWLSSYTLQPICRDYQCENLAIFNKLEYLELEVETRASSHYWSAVRCLLERSPNLTSLAIIGKGAASYCGWNEPDTNSVCLSNLEILKVKGFYGREEEMRLLEYLLRNPLMLKEMTISYRNIAAEEKESLLERLSEFTWRSSSCQVAFF